MRQEKQIRILLWIAFGGFALAVILLASSAFAQDCENCKQKADGSWDCRRPVAGLVVGGWKAPTRIGQAVTQRVKAHPAVCKIFTERPVMFRGRQAVEKGVGSGVLVWKGTKRALVLTVHHLFRDKPKRVIVIFPNRQRYESTSWQSESGCDLSAINIPSPDGIEPMSISEVAPPSPGDHVFLCGFDGKLGNYRMTPGVVKGYSSHRVSGGFSPRHDLVVIGEGKEGNSGGPIVNSEGELVAIIWGTDGRDSYGTYAAQIGVFLTSDKFIAPWRITPWNARTDQERIRADAGAYAPPMVPVVPIAPATNGMDIIARRMAEDALRRVGVLEADMGKTQKNVIDVDSTATQAFNTAESAYARSRNIETGLFGKLRGYVFKMVGSFGLGGGLLATGIAGILFFLVRRQGIRIAQLFDRLTDFIPGPLDDKLLDPLAYKLGAILSGKPVPTYAHTSGLDPWGKPYPGQQPPTGPTAAPPPAQPVSSPTNAELLAEIQKLKDKPVS